MMFDYDFIALFFIIWSKMIILTGPSASGKTELAKILLQKYNIQKVVTHTTRPIRHNEIDGIDYHFVSEKMFVTLKKQDAFVETTLYNQYHYGTSFKELGDHKVVTVDPNGLKVFVALNNPHYITFFIEANEVTRINRMLIRGQDLAFAKQRIAWDRVSFLPENLPPIDHVIDNESVTIEEAADTIHALYVDTLKSRQ